MLGPCCSKKIYFSFSCADGYIQVEHQNWLQFQKQIYVLKLYSYNWTVMQPGNGKTGNMGSGNSPTDGFSSSILLSTGRKCALLPLLLPNSCFGFPMGRAPSSKLNIYFTENSEACSSELYTLSKMLTRWFWPSLLWALKSSYSLNELMSVAEGRRQTQTGWATCCPHIFKSAPEFLVLLPLNSHSVQGTRKKQKCLRKKRKKTAINLPK